MREKNSYIRLLLYDALLITISYFMCNLFTKKNDLG
jgi:hypothetical protein